MARNNMISVMSKVSKIGQIITKKRLLILIGCCVIIYLLIYMTFPKRRSTFIPSTMNYSNINTYVYMQQSHSNEFNNSQEMIEETITGDRNIFFLETGHIKKGHEIHLNARQGCAVESAALMNPGMDVYLFIFTAKSWNYTDKTSAILTQLKSYKNIFIRHLDLETYLKNSPMIEWWNITGHLSGSKWFTSHLSDALRYYTLWKFGGIYLDLDVVVKTSLEYLEDFTAYENTASVSSGVLGFHLTDVGRRYANACLFEMMREFHGDEWGYNGPGVITRVLKRICNTYSICEMDVDRCDGFTVFPPSVFYPISPGKWRRYFDHINLNKTMRMINNSLAIHVWNSQSQSTIVQIGSRVPYELIAAKYCPRVYKTCDIIF